MNKICLIIPVLNEEKNISKIYSQIKKISIKLKILFIDEKSSDNTKNEIFKLRKKNKNSFYILRKKKRGIGSAHKDAIKWCYSKKFSTIITMDCDGTHNPKYIPRMLEKSKFYDIIITSRFKKNNSILIPAGFAHGFLALDNENYVLYSNNNYREKNYEVGLLWNDQSLNIKWPKKKFIISKKDKLNITLKEYKKKYSI